MFRFLNVWGEYDMYEIYQKLKERKNVTDYQVSKETGIPRSTFSDWKNGKYLPKKEKLQKLADYFNVSLEYLTTGKDTPKESISGKTYYFDDETAEKAQELFENPDLRILFDAAKDVKAENLQLAAEMLKRFKETAE